MPDPLAELDDDLRDELLRAVALRLEHEGSLDALLGSDAVRALVEALGPERARLWLAVEERVNELADTRGRAGFVAGYLVGVAAGAAVARVGRPGDRDVAALAGRVAATVFASGLEPVEALAAARAAVEAAEASLGDGDLARRG